MAVYDPTPKHIKYPTHYTTDFHYYGQPHLDVKKQYYYMNHAHVAAHRSKCYLKVGCVIVKDDAIISTGFNGHVKGEQDCTPETCNENTSSCSTIHAELNAILNVARRGGAPLDGAMIFITHSPCSKCESLLKQAGIKSWVWQHTYKGRNER